MQVETLAAATATAKVKRKPVPSPMLKRHLTAFVGGLIEAGRQDRPAVVVEESSLVLKNLGPSITAKEMPGDESHDAALKQGCTQHGECECEWHEPIEATIIPSAGLRKTTPEIFKRFTKRFKIPSHQWQRVVNLPESTHSSARATSTATLRDNYRSRKIVGTTTLLTASCFEQSTVIFSRTSSPAFSSTTFLSEIRSVNVLRAKANACAIMIRSPTRGSTDFNSVANWICAKRTQKKKKKGGEF